VAAAAVYLGVSQLLFNGGWIVPVLTPLVALALGLVGGLVVDYVAAAFERQRVYDLFSRFVPDEVVKEVVAQADGARLGGVARVCTVMFSDLRGFTAFSSDNEPQRVIDVVNAYLDEMSDAIMGAGGTLVAYMGDGILAVFGAPLEQPDHADRALAAALDMINTRLPRFNAVARSLGAESDFRMGVGLNSGTVISGQVGCERRLEYTTIGDTTNLASRIEGATKNTPHMLLFSGETRKSFTQEPSGVLFVQETVLRGSSRPVELWTVPETAEAGGDAGLVPAAATVGDGQAPSFTS
jgi:adenylate cyclase